MGMERQYATVLLLATSLLLALTALVVGEGSAVARRRFPKHTKSANRVREASRNEVTAGRRDTTFRAARQLAIHKASSGDYPQNRQEQVRKGLVLLSAVFSRPKETSVERLTDADSVIASGSSEAEVSGSSDQATHTVRAQLVAAARNFLGLPYRWGGMSKRGVDCSGMVKMLFAKLRINLPRSSREQIQSGEEVTKDDLKVGDLVFFASRGQTPTHVGVYVGNNQLLHAGSKARQVIISDLNQPWFNKRFLAARRVIDVSNEDASM